jgi:hypothetical protein
VPLTYIASKSRWWAFWQALRAAGLHTNSSWIDWCHNRDGTEPEPDEWATHSEKCIREAATCDLLLLYVRPDENHLGALVECGSALGAGKWVCGSRRTIGRLSGTIRAAGRSRR